MCQYANYYVICYSAVNWHIGTLNNYIYGMVI